MGEGESIFILEKTMRSCFEFIKKKTNHKLVGAEIGVREGINAEDILKNLNVKKLYLVDSWQGKGARFFKIVHNKFSNDKKVCILKVTSVMASKLITEPLDFVYIDANHSYKAVLHDLRIWTKKVKSGGFVCGHDYTKIWPGVRGAVWKFCAKRNIRYSIQTNGEKAGYKGRTSISCNWWFQKGGENEVN